MLQNYTLFNQPLSAINQPKVLINTLNAHSFNTSLNDKDFEKALQYSLELLPDGKSVVWAKRMLTGENYKRLLVLICFL